MGPILCLDLTKDNKYIIVGLGDDNTIKVFDFNTTELVYRFIHAHQSKQHQTSDPKFMI